MRGMKLKLPRHRPRSGVSCVEAIMLREVQVRGAGGWVNTHSWMESRLHANPNAKPAAKESNDV